MATQLEHSLDALVAHPPSGRPRAVLIDSQDYAQAVMLQNKPIPWHDHTAYANFFSQSQRLLQPDFALLALDRFMSVALARNVPLQIAMAAKPRTGFALRTLLADAATSELVVAFAQVFEKTQSEPVVLQIPSPIQWLARTSVYAPQYDAVELNADDAENAAMYVADWLRGFAGLRLAGVILEDRPVRADGHEAGAIITPRVALDVYSPLANIADHYNWTLGLRDSSSVALRGTAAGAFIPEEFWYGQNCHLGEGNFLFGEIPSDAVPEVVLSQMARIV
ncbi:MAG: hypothetical protein H7201_15115 [Candidatus Saccharibacteria bacterium]|nr:hypothetical protein [Microbacteriaceae bacterium]